MLTTLLPTVPDAAELPDSAVVARVLAGDRAVFEILMRRHNQRLYRTIRSVLRDESEVEDVMQQAYVNAYLHLADFEGRSQFSTWLTRIALHEAFSRLRRRSRLVALDDHEGEEPTMAPITRDPDPERQTLTGEMRDLLSGAIDRLPPSYRTVFVLREVEGLSTAETGESLEIPEQTVKTRLHRARALLRRDLFDRTAGEAARVWHFELTRCGRVVAGVFARLAAIENDCC